MPLDLPLEIRYIDPIYKVGDLIYSNTEPYYVVAIDGDIMRHYQIELMADSIALYDGNRRIGAILDTGTNADPISKLIYKDNE